MKKLTPMSKLKAHFVEFEKVAGFDGKFELTKRSGKTDYICGEDFHKKEIKSDFIRVYKTSKNSSVAFVFNYVDREPTIEIVTKMYDYHLSSAPYTIEEFKILIKKINLYLKNNECRSLYQYIKQTCIISPNEMDDKIKIFKKDFVNKFKQELEQRKTLKNKITKSNEILNENIAVLNEYSESIPEIKEVADLREKIKNLEKIIKNKKFNKKKELNITGLLEAHQNNMDAAYGNIEYLKESALTLNKELPIEMVLNILTDL